jgi:CRP-like cAMP-binding protein
MTAEYGQFKRLVDSIHPLPLEDWDEFSHFFIPFSAKRKEQLTAAGDIEKHLYFVCEGVQRIYYLDDQQREATIVFTYAPSFGGVIDSMFLQTPSRYCYETLTTSTFLRAKFTDIRTLMAKRRAVESLISSGVMMAFSGVLERLLELQSFSSEEKFRKLLQRSPHILQLVPHKYLANYLGIDPTNFSKLINNVRI